MPSQLITNDNIEFICGREFTYAGKKYKLGQDFPQENATNIDTMVRTRYLIPVVESTDVKPRHWHHHVRIKSEILEKLNVKKQPKAKGRPPGSKNKKAPAKKAVAKKAAPAKKAVSDG